MELQPIVPADLAAAHTAIRERIGAELIDTVVILGSGLGTVAHALLSDPAIIAYEDLPGVPQGPAVGGHMGELHLGRIGTHRVVIFLGRFHLYQGLSAREVAFPIRLGAALGATEVLITNAAGSLDPALAPGELMLIADHINLTGETPLDGRTPIHAGSPFVALATAYSTKLRLEAHWAAHHVHIQLHEGIYVGVRGPQYETPAEAAYFHNIGGSAIGMSTVLETIAARALGLKVLGLSVITNHSGTAGNHNEVLQAASLAQTKLEALLGTYLHREELHGLGTRQSPPAKF